MTSEGALHRLRRRVDQLEEEDVGLAAVDLPLVDKSYSRVVVVVPLGCMRMSAVGRIVSRAHRAGLI